MLDCSRTNTDDLYFVCYMIERVARQLKQRNRYVVNSIGRTGLYHLISCAETLHCENPDKVADDWIRDYNLTEGILILPQLTLNLQMLFQQRLIWVRCISG